MIFILQQLTESIQVVKQIIKFNKEVYTIVFCWEATTLIQPTVNQVCKLSAQELFKHGRAKLFNFALKGLEHIVAIRVIQFLSNNQGVKHFVEFL
jgi:hypothetical protein